MLEWIEPFIHQLDSFDDERHDSVGRRTLYVELLLIRNV